MNSCAVIHNIEVNSLQDLLQCPLALLLGRRREDISLWEQCLSQGSPGPVQLTQYRDLLFALGRLTPGACTGQVFFQLDKLLHRLCAALQQLPFLQMLSLQDYFDLSRRMGGRPSPLGQYQRQFRTATYATASPTESNTVSNVLEYLVYHFAWYTHQDRLRQDMLMYDLLLMPMRPA